MIRRSTPWLVLTLFACLLLPTPGHAVEWPGGVSVEATRIHSETFDTHAMIYTAGPAGAAPVLLVHGLGTEGARFWSPLVKALADEYRVIAVDLPGFGESGKPNVVYSPENYAAFLDEVASGRVDAPMAVVGHSMGATVALYYANRHRQRVDRLVLASAAGILHGAAYAHFLSRMGVQRFVPELPGVGDAAGKLVQRILTKFDRLGPDPATTLKTAESRQVYLNADPNRIAALALVATDFSRIVRRTSVPTYILWGGAERVAPLRVGYLLTALLPKARLKVVEGGSHMLPVEETDRFNRLVSNALQLSPRGYRDFAHDEYPVSYPEAPPRSERTGECRGERGRVFSGSYRRLLIYDCDEVVIRDAHIGRLEILSSEVEVRNSRVHAGDVAVVLANSTVEMTAVKVSGVVGVDATGSRVDAAGVTIKGQRSAVRAPTPSVFTFSVSRIDSPHTQAYVHDVVSVTAGDPL